MKPLKYILLAAITATSNAGVSSALAGESLIQNVRILSIRTYTGGDFGGCMATIDKNVNSEGNNTLTCGSGTAVSFDCDGTNVSKSAAAANFSQAQLGLVAGNYVDIRVDDSRTYNVNVCLAKDIFVKNTRP